MKKARNVATTATLAIFLVAIHQTTARSEGCASPPELIEFVSEETGHQRLLNCPRVKVTTNAILNSMFAEASAHGEEPLAAFLPYSGQILLSPDINLSTVLGRSYMVHELVHASQAINQQSSTASCPGLLEEQAYRVQASYLRRHNLIETARGFELMGMMLSACPQPY